MTAPGFALFDTAVGVCAIAWGAHGVTGVSLPSSSAAALRANMRKRIPDAKEADPPPAIQQAIARIIALLDGGDDDLRSIELDMAAVPDFHRRVLDFARTIPPGRTMTYGEVATSLGDPAAARAVGQALGANPFPIIVPCHRVLAASGKTGGFSAPGGVSTKMKMLTIERAKVTDTPSLFADLPLAAKPKARR